MNVKLVVVGGEVRPSEIILQLPVVLGRGREVGVSLPQALVSRRHCELYESQGCLRVRDLGSLNGTFIGSKRIDDAELLSGGLLSVGTVTFRAVFGGDLNQPSARRDSTAFVPSDDASIFPSDTEGESSTIQGEQEEATELKSSHENPDEMDRARVDE